MPSWLLFPCFPLPLSSHSLVQVPSGPFQMPLAFLHIYNQLSPQRTLGSSHVSVFSVTINIAWLDFKHACGTSEPLFASRPPPPPILSTTNPNSISPSFAPAQHRNFLFPVLAVNWVESLFSAHGSPSRARKSEFTPCNKRSAVWVPAGPL